MQQARALEEAKARLQESLEDAVNSYLAKNPEPIELDVEFDDTGHKITSDVSTDDEALVTQVKSLVDLFRHHDAVQRSGVQVRHVTAIDSNGDGQAAVNVRYVYPDEG